LDPGAQSSAELPPEQSSDAFDFEPAGIDPQGRALYRVRIRAGGNPYVVAATKLTPLFQVDGRDALAYLSDAYFRANPGRTAFTIQPGDEFTLALPPDTFLVRWQREYQQPFGHPARVREYVSERGDRLRYYLLDPFPIRYEQESADAGGRTTIRFHADLAYLLGTGRTDPIRLAQVVYQVAEPDIFQVQAIRRLAAGLRPGASTTLEVDRSHAYLDPVREVWGRASATEAVQEPERAHLVRAVFSA